MKRSLFCILLMLFSLSGFTQTYSSPESLEYDYANDRWLISNKSANNILARSSATGVLSIFATGISSPHGIEIANDTVYVCSGSTLKAYELNTGASVFSINLGASYLNGITHDSTYLYITDFSAKVIYRFNMITRDYSIFIPVQPKSPNGIIFDQLNNRCVFVNWGPSAPVMAFDVTSAVVTTLTPTTLSNCDGIAIDGAGDFYISSWGLNGISKFDNSFSTGPVTVVTGLTSPADIFYNIQSDTLGVANSGSLSNTSYHFFGSTTSLNDIRGSASKFMLVPNPVIDDAFIHFNSKAFDMVELRIYDASGRPVHSPLTYKLMQGENQLLFNREGLSAGKYYISIRGEQINETGMFLIAD